MACTHTQRKQVSQCISKATSCRAKGQPVPEIVESMLNRLQVMKTFLLVHLETACLTKARLAKVPFQQESIIYLPA